MVPVKPAVKPPPLPVLSVPLAFHTPQPPSSASCSTFVHGPHKYLRLPECEQWWCQWKLRMLGYFFCFGFFLEIFGAFFSSIFSPCSDAIAGLLRLLSSMMGKAAPGVPQGVVPTATEGQGQARAKLREGQVSQSGVSQGQVK